MQTTKQKLNALFSVPSFTNIDNCNLITKELIKAHFSFYVLQLQTKIENIKIVQESCLPLLTHVYISNNVTGETHPHH